MIRIIKGTYGRVVGGRVEAMTKRSAPFSLPESREAELVAAGVAEYVETPAQAKKSTRKKSGKREAVANTEETPEAETPDEV